MGKIQVEANDGIKNAVVLINNRIFSLYGIDFILF